MEDIEKLLKTTLGEIEKMLTTKSVVGDPLTVEDNTIIPLVSIGFAFGGGGGSGKSPKERGEGMGAGAGGGGGVKPVGVIVVSKDGVRIRPIKGTITSVADTIADTVDRVVDRRWGKKEEDKEE